MEASTQVAHRWHMGPEARVLVILTGVLLAFGLATVYSASAIVEMQAGYGHAHLLLRQVIGMALGVALFAIAAKMDAEVWERWAWPIMILSLVLLVIVILPFTASIAPRVHGSRRYLFGSSLQPSELAKLAVIVWTSMLVIKKGPALRRLTKGLLPFLLVIGALDVLVMLEPDLSTAMMFTLMMGIILFAGGVRVGHFVALGVMLIPLLYVKIERLNYVLLRMTAFFDPGAAPLEVSYQLRQSLIAVGSGQIFGVGFGRGRQQYGFLPFGYDDFIAGHIGEEWGFVGLTLLVLMFALYAALGFRIARKARSPFLQLVAVGLTVTMVLTAYLHIGVATGLLPTTGLTLPFISYGRSNLVLSLIMTGILVNIGSSREKVFGISASDPLSFRALPAR
ncbi:MAG TPA: putative peptidoglycan glycosyltransferase FtsW [Gemmatimonadaceae bacterium]|jgi:cell division protein FtsW|nr:putative peptidoglycan glycosyltransferase FtsW [Gemmatimonadaceae bacterium]